MIDDLDIYVNEEDYVKKENNTMELIVGQKVIHCNIEWIRTHIRDSSSFHKDSYYYMPTQCYCDEDFEGTGYTYNDEWGYCDWCNEKITQIKGDNSDMPANFNEIEKALNLYTESRR